MTNPPNPQPDSPKHYLEGEHAQTTIPQSSQEFSRLTKLPAAGSMHVEQPPNPSLRKIQDPLYGTITVIEGEHGMIMHNFPPDKNGRWVKRGNTFTYELTPNRAARRAK